MPRVQFTRHLQRFFPQLAEVEVPAATVAELVTALDVLHPGLRDFLVDERGTLRKHVNVFVENEMVRDRERLSDPLQPETRVFVLQALSGG